MQRDDEQRPMPERGPNGAPRDADADRWRKLRWWFQQRRSRPAPDSGSTDRPD